MTDEPNWTPIEKLLNGMLLTKQLNVDELMVLWKYERENRLRLHELQQQVCVCPRRFGGPRKFISPSCKNPYCIRRRKEKEDKKQKQLEEELKCKCPHDVKGAFGERTRYINSACKNPKCIADFKDVTVNKTIIFDTKEDQEKPLSQLPNYIGHWN